LLDRPKEQELPKTSRVKAEREREREREALQLYQEIHMSNLIRRKKIFVTSFVSEDANFLPHFLDLHEDES
jgi:hypothetical protein